LRNGAAPQAPRACPALLARQGHLAGHWTSLVQQACYHPHPTPGRGAQRRCFPRRAPPGKTVAFFFLSSACVDVAVDAAPSNVSTYAPGVAPILGGPLLSDLPSGPSSMPPPRCVFAAAYVPPHMRGAAPADGGAPAPGGYGGAPAYGGGYAGECRGGGGCCEVGCGEI
jgi:hypothetical protein